MICETCKKEISGNHASFLNHKKSCDKKHLIRICERCGSEYRLINGGTARFCSRSCSNSKNQTEESKKKISIGVKKSIEKLRISNPEKLKRRWEKERLSDEHKKKISNGLILYNKKKEQFYKKCVKENKYELLSRPARRKFLLEETNNSCEICKNNKWLDKPIWLEIHHKDGNNKNNRRENLLVVCLNCHAILDNNYRFTGRNRK